jgi:hypothetical protein
MTTDPIEWAHAEARRLANAPRYPDSIVDSRVAKPEATAALEFLRTRAAGSHFYQDADSYFSGPPTGGSTALKGVATNVEQWARFIEDGLAGALPSEAQVRVDAATDLTEQVQLLLDEPEVHPAAPVVLAGAALEEFLRSRVVATGTTISGTPGIDTYASALQAAGDLSSTELNAITAWAGQRNEAAHGRFENLSKQRAQIMVDGINLFMQKRR